MVRHTVPPHSRVTDLLRPVLFRLEAPDDLSVDDVGADEVPRAVVPGREQLLLEEQLPQGRLALVALPPHFVLALRDGVHHVPPVAAQGPQLGTATGKQKDVTLSHVPLQSPEPVWVNLHELRKVLK